VKNRGLPWKMGVKWCIWVWYPSNTRQLIRGPTLMWLESNVFFSQLLALIYHYHPSSGVLQIQDRSPHCQDCMWLVATSIDCSDGLVSATRPWSYTTLN